MKFFLKLVFLSLGLFSPGLAQHLGESEQIVRKTLGNPMAVRKTDERNIWLYSEGRRVVFEKGVVVSASGFEGGTSADGASGSSEKRSPESSAGSTQHSTISEVHTLPAKKSSAPVPKSSSFTPELKHQWQLIVVGFAVVVMGICGIIIIIEAFRASILWGLAVLFFPIAQLLFVATHWSDTKKPFLISILCTFGLGLAVFAFGD